MYEVGCRHFNGYKPCSKNSKCDSQCPHRDVPQNSILIVHLGAMGAVLRSTALLAMIKKKYPSSLITWVTEESTKPLIENNPLVDKVLSISARDQLILAGLEFDIGFFVDKSPEVAGLRKLVKPDLSYGFTVNPHSGAIIPAQPSSCELWEVGLDNQKKFFQNTKTELQLVAEALELPYHRDEYQLHLTLAEEHITATRAKVWSLNGSRKVIGLNTGTSGVLPNKTIPVETWQSILNEFRYRTDVHFVLLGGPSDSDRNEAISRGFSVTLSPTNLGLRDGICSVDAVDMVVTGDSLGMHMAIARKKHVIAWFGPSCSHEIDLYGRGAKIKSPMPCSPCWKRRCAEVVPCSESIDVSQIKTEIDQWLMNHSCRENKFFPAATIPKEFST